MLHDGDPTRARAGDIGEDAVAAVAIQHVRAEVRDVEIDPAVVVVVARAGAHAVVAMSNAGLLGDVVERAVAAISEQAVPCLPRDRRIGHRSAVDQEDVDPAVVVVVEEQPARADGLDQVLVGARAVDVAEVDPGVTADVGELHVRSEAVASLARHDTAAHQHDGHRGGCRARIARPFTGAPRLVTLPCSALSYMSLARAASSMRPSLRVQLRELTVDERIRAEREGDFVLLRSPSRPSGARQRGGELQVIGRPTWFALDRLSPERHGALVAALGGAQRRLFLDVERHGATPVGQLPSLRLLDALELLRRLSSVSQRISAVASAYRASVWFAEQFDGAPQRRDRVLYRPAFR